MTRKGLIFEEPPAKGLGFPETYLIPISDLGLPNRALNTTIGARLTLTGELSTMTDPDLLRIRGFGPLSLADVKEALDVHGAGRLYDDSNEAWEEFLAKGEKWRAFLARYQKSGRPGAKAFAETRRYDPADVRAFYAEIIAVSQG
tara:strand:- start:190 stop:624 length:435 start_codon:yes stop_codon:yes gene_type:complete